MLPGIVMPVNRGFFGGDQTINSNCSNLRSNFNTNFSITNSISLDPNVGITAACFNGPIPWLQPPVSLNTVLTNNLLAGGISGTEQTDWNTVGSANQFPANLAAVGLLSDHKALDPMSAYYSTGAGANLETCFAETAIRNGTPASTSCVSTPSTVSTSISGRATISGKATIH